MKFGYTIAYVEDVAASLDFFSAAFGFPLRFISPEADYGELDTGGTTLAFATHALAETNFAGGYEAVDKAAKPLGIELGFVTDDVPAAHAKAIAAGATELSAPKTKPWGQVVSYLRCPNGVLVELCTPVG
ncbi:glyoxalase [Devosia epidermidihirudinis]|uniref:Glyoxalase n=1 Tax=Devosia epidermidihirudinis TaxID=1293439 RepID=A0A0F5Q900_9HYPH|nr:VOC family protein [Devosia epidermidihirudinis]KKC36514.1 glyoxalase [Devosia epidermidihirudinis]